MNNKILMAWELASESHKDQKYGDFLPYIYHVGHVYLIALIVSETDASINKELLCRCAMLHDVLEDTEMNENIIKDQFGVEVLNGVKALT